jgi:hypothetical protein
MPVDNCMAWGVTSDALGPSDFKLLMSELPCICNKNHKVSNGLLQRFKHTKKKEYAQYLMEIGRLVIAPVVHWHHKEYWMALALKKATE